MSTPDAKRCTPTRLPAAERHASSLGAPIVWGAASLLLHAAILAAAWRPALPRLPSAPVEFAMALQPEEPPAPPESAPPIEPALAGNTTPEPAVQAPLPVAPPRPRPAVIARPAKSAPRAANPTVAPEIAAALAPVAQPPPSAGIPAWLRQQISDAVNAAAIYPAAARLQRREGQAQVDFEYRNGTVSAIGLAHSSSSTLLDAAALEAVRRAHYPLPPQEVAGQSTRLLVWVNFTLSGGG